MPALLVPTDADHADALAEHYQELAELNAGLEDWAVDPDRPTIALAGQPKDHDLDPAEEPADPGLVAMVATMIAADHQQLHDANPHLRLNRGKWQRKYAIAIEELRYIAAIQPTTKQRAAILAYAKNRLEGAIKDGHLVYNPYAEDGTPTFWLDEDLDVEGSLYRLWQHPGDLSRVFDGTPPRPLLPVDPAFGLARIDAARQTPAA